ncbi:hypothetical protein LEC33_16635 [Salmonella enterica]|nr:hypothetical protein [Salmonella enterica]MDJ7048469.1 hypothetical protein [Salmonella enterica]MDJ7337169.1 hypothetical protein [Salmonella enterica]
MKYMIDAGDENLKKVFERLYVNVEDNYFEERLNRLAEQAKSNVKAIQRCVDNKILALGYLNDNEKFRDKRTRMLSLADQLAKVRSVVEDLIDDLPKPETKGENSEKV